MKRDLSILFLSVLMCLSLCTVNIKAEDEDPNVDPTNNTNEVVEYVAKVNDQQYTTLNDAITNSNNGDTIELIKSTSESITIPGGKEITLNIPENIRLTNTDNQHTITNNGTLTITGSGIVDCVSNAKAALYNGVNATATLKENITYTRSKEASTPSGDKNGNTYYTIQNKGGTLNIYDNVKVNQKSETSTGYVSSLIANEGDSKSTLYIYGGLFEGGRNTVKNGSNGYLYVYGGTLANTAQYVLLNASYAEIHGGTFTSSDKANAIYNGCFTSYKEESKGQITKENYKNFTPDSITDTKLLIDGGTINGNIVANYQWYQDYYNDGVYWYSGYYGLAYPVISGGLFLYDVSDKLSEGYYCAKNKDGYYQVAKKGEYFEVADPTSVLADDIDQIAVIDEDGYEVEKVTSAVNVLTGEAKSKAESTVNDFINENKVNYTNGLNPNYDAKSYEYLDIDLTAYNDTKSDGVTVYSLKEDSLITVVLPTEVAKKFKDKAAKVIGIHEDDTTSIYEGTMINDYVVQFDTSKFSTFVIVGFDVKSGKKEVINNSTNNTSGTEIKVEASDSVIDSLLTKEEKDEVKNGVNVEITPVISKASDTSDVNKIKSNDYSIGLTLDITLNKVVGNTSTKITKIENGSVEITIDVPDELINTNSNVDRTYLVKYVHDGELKEISDGVFNKDTKTYTFKANEFSTYALVYKDTSKNTTKHYTCEEAHNSINWVWSDKTGTCVYRVTNTSLR